MRKFAFGDLLRLAVPPNAVNFISLCCKDRCNSSLTKAGLPQQLRTGFLLAGAPQSLLVGGGAGGLYPRPVGGKRNPAEQTPATARNLLMTTTKMKLQLLSNVRGEAAQGLDQPLIGLAGSSAAGKHLDQGLAGMDKTIF